MMSIIVIKFHHTHAEIYAYKSIIVKVCLKYMLQLENAKVMAWFHIRMVQQKC